MARSSRRKERLPWAPSLTRKREARKGTTVSETSSEARTVATTATGMERMKRPAAPGSASSGTKAKTRVAVQPSTDMVICRVAAMAAARGVQPSRMKRATFSTTTTESSTSSPRAMTKPTMESWLTE
jgi:hypothetical protein